MSPRADLAERPRRSGPRSRRWVRLVTPLAVVLTLMIGSGIAYQVQQPDRSDPGYLSPTSDAATGGRTLADRLTNRGVSIQRLTKTSEALVEAVKGDATLFIPVPAMVHPFYLRMIKLLPASTQVVLVAADRRSLADSLLPVAVAGSRLAARPASPDCGYQPAAAAGTAAVFRDRYWVAKDDQLQQCYGGALAVLRRGMAEVTLVGADDPFRNDRIDEHHNSALATGLLSTRSRVLWLDLHQIEPRPKYVDNPALASQDPAPPSLGPGSPDPDFPLPSGTVREEFPEYDNKAPSDQPEATASNPLWSAFPPWVFATVAVLAVAVLLFAVAAGRRMGGPVSEPLPVTVRTTETVEGRGRLYLRAKARGRATATLRGNTRRRLAHLLDLPPDPARDDLVAAAARHSGWSTEAVDRTLFGADPTDDPELVATALNLTALLAAVTGQASPPGPAEPAASEPAASEPAASEGEQR